MAKKDITANIGGLTAAYITAADQAPAPTAADPQGRNERKNHKRSFLFTDRQDQSLQALALYRSKLLRKEKGTFSGASVSLNQVLADAVNEFLQNHAEEVKKALEENY